LFLGLAVLTAKPEGEKAMKKILFGNEARQKIKEGIDKCVDVVKVSLGGQGKNVLIYNGTATEIINDGVSIAREVNVKDEVEQAGIQLAKQCANQTNEDAGDGTTTTLVLLQSILNEIIKEIQTENPRELRDRLFKEANEVLSNVEVKQITGKQDVYNLALTSSLNEDMAKIISEIYDELGKEAQISIEETSRNVIEKEIIGGIKFESKKAELKFLRDDRKIILDNCKVLVKDKVDSFKDIENEVVGTIKKRIKSMVVVANSFSNNAILSITKIDNFRIIPIEYTMINPIEDIETYVGETVDRVVVEKNFTTLIGGKGDVSELVKTLEARLKEEESVYEKEQLENRIAKLKGKVAVIKIGRNTDVERNEAVLKLEDALGTVKGAYEMGYCKGGGLALKELGYRFNVYDQICENAGSEGMLIGNEIIDSFKTVKFSLLNAISTATSILMVESALIEIDED
jgi:chaperonin GroEL